MRRIIPCILLLSLLLTGCAIHPMFAPLATEAQIKEYVRETYGSAKLISSDITETCHLYTFRHTALGFEYTVESYLHVIRDGATVFGYEERKRSNFDTQYRQAIWETVSLDAMPDNTHAVLNPDTNGYAFAYVIVPDKMYSDVGANGAKYLYTQLDSRDGQDLFHDYAIVVRDASGNVIGRFDFAENKYISEEIANRSYYHRRAQEIMRCEDVMLTDSEMMRLGDVPGLSEENIVDVLGRDYSIVTCYYFLSGHKKYFITDVCVMYDNGPHQYIYNVTDGHSMTPYLDPYDPHKR